MDGLSCIPWLRVGDGMSVTSLHAMLLEIGRECSFLDEFIFNCGVEFVFC